MENGYSLELGITGKRYVKEWDEFVSIDRFQNDITVYDTYEEAEVEANRLSVLFSGMTIHIEAV